MSEDKEMLGKHTNNLGRFGAARGGTAHAQCSPLAMRHCGGKLQSEACALSFERSASAIPSTRYQTRLWSATSLVPAREERHDWCEVMDSCCEFRSRPVKTVKGSAGRSVSGGVLLR